jgi:hypothetical protein
LLHDEDRGPRARGYNCYLLEKVPKEAVGIPGIEAEIVKVTDYGRISSYGVLRTPGLVINGRVVSAGRIPSAGDIAETLIAEEVHA